MADVQTENGFTKIANELLAALTKTKLSGAEFMICLAVITRTYGWNKKDDQISLTQFQSLTGMDRKSCARSIKRLVAQKVLGSGKGDTSNPSTYWIQKDYDKWDASVKIATSGKINTRASGKNDPQLVAFAYNTQNTLKTTKYILHSPKEVSPTKIVQDYFYNKYLETFGEVYVAQFAKDGAIFKDLLKTLPVARIEELITSFFQSQDDFIKHAGYTVGVFRSQINKLKNPSSSQDELLRKAGLLNDADSRAMDKRNFLQG